MFGVPVISARVVELDNRTLQDARLVVIAASHKLGFGADRAKYLCLMIDRMAAGGRSNEGTNVAGLRAKAGSEQREKVEKYAFI